MSRWRIQRVSSAALLVAVLLGMPPAATGRPSQRFRRGDEVATVQYGAAVREHGQPAERANRQIGGTDPVTGASRVLVACTAPCTAVDAPSWSPDGRWLAFHTTARTDGPAFPTGALAVVGSDGAARRLGSRSLELLSWAPDGSALLAVDDRRTIMLVRPATGTATPIVMIGWQVPQPVLPVWSPTADRIAYLLPPDMRGPGLLLVQPIAGDPRVIARGGVLRDADGLTWSPTGDRFVVDTPRGSAILDLSGRTIAMGLAGFHAQWSPTGSQLALRIPAGTGVIVVDADGRRARRLRLPGFLGSYFWTADGDGLVTHTARGWFAVPLGGGRIRRIHGRAVYGSDVKARARRARRAA
jgi:Tol biopolymer transport system component